MLNFVIGTSGTGKTSYIVDKIHECVKDSQRTMLIVPEQFSFEGEKLLYDKLGPEISLKVDVLSFTRLCNMIFRTYGGLAGKDISKTAKYIFMSLALEDLQDQLEVYKKSSLNAAFLDIMLSTCSEFKNAGITSQSLDLFLAGCKDNELYRKMSDINLIYSSFQAFIERSYNDPEDSIIKACEILEKHNFFSGYTVFIDGFTAFMAGEHKLLKFIISQAKDVYFALTADSIYERDKFELFSPVKKTITRLIRHAKRDGIAVSTPVVMQEAYRFISPELKALSKHFLSGSKNIFEKPCQNISFFKADDIYSEIEYTAAAISHLVREEGYRYRDIAVIARDTDIYNRAVELIFGEYEIPYFSDYKDEIENKPVIKAVLGALEVIESSFDYNSVTGLLKSPVLGFTYEEASILENYAYVWSIKGKLWQQDFNNNPRGLMENMNEEDEKALRRINNVRSRLIKPLEELWNYIKNANGKSFATGIFVYLENVEASKNLFKYAEALSENEKGIFLDESAQLWDILVDILDIFGSSIGSRKLKWRRLCELFRLSVNNTDVLSIPQTTDQVIIGNADRIRPTNIKAAFVIGANDGKFPLNATESGVFSDKEKELLSQSGIALSPGGVDQVLLERFYAYFALTQAQEKLYVSWYSSSLSGSTEMPGIIVSGIKSLFPKAEVQSPDEMYYIANKKTALKVLSKLNEDTMLRSALYGYFSGDEIITKYDMAKNKPDHKIAEPHIVNSLFSGDLRLSPSRVEKYYKCPFSYFAEYGLRLAKRRKAEYSPLESGSVIHYVLQVVMQKYTSKDIEKMPVQELENIVREIIKEYLNLRVQNKEMLGERFNYLFMRLCSLLCRILKHVAGELLQGEFAPVAYEAEIKQGGNIEPLHLKALDGTEVLVEGVIDRLDIMTDQKGQKYVRVVDYKSGSKSFKLEDIVQGLNLQMLLYLFTVCENGKGELENLLPGGILYMPVKESYISAGRYEDGESIKTQQLKSLTMSGLVLEDEEVIRGMEKEVKGIYIPVKLKKDGSVDSRASVAKKAELGRLSKKVKNLIIDMASAIKTGQIPSQPVSGSDYDVCRYCDYFSVCGYEDGDSVREVAKMSKKEVFDYLEKEEEAVAQMD